MQSDARGAVETGGEHAPFNPGDARVFLKRFETRGVVHDVGFGDRGVVRVDPQHAVGGGVGDVEDTRVLVEDHVTGDAGQPVDLDVGVPLNDAVGVVVFPRVVVGLEVVANQFTVVAVVVPVHVVDVVGDAHAVGRFVKHVDVASQQPVAGVLVLPRKVAEGRRPQGGSHEIVRI